MRLTILLLTAGCGNLFRGDPPVPDSLPATTAAAMTSLPAAEGAVRVLHLQGLAPDLTGFAARTGCAATLTPARTSYALWSEVPDGGFDLVLAPSDVSRRLIRDDVLQPVPPELLPSFATVPGRFRTAPFNQLEGEPFGVPLQWGVQGLLTLDAAFPTPPDTWRVLYEPQTLPDGTSSAGRIQAYEGPIAFAEAALALRVHDPELGIGDDPYALTRKQFRAAVEAVRRQGEVVDRYWQSPDTQVEDVVSGRVVAASSWALQARALAERGVSVTFDVPAEGATAWVITAMIPRDAEHPGCAVRLAEHLLSLEQQAALADRWASVPVLEAACPADGCAYAPQPSDEMHFWRSPDRRCDLDTDCVAWHEWIARYTLARGGL